MTLPLRTAAPAKINLGLFVGLVRADGKHEIVSVMQSISLADELTLEPGVDGADRDEVICPGVDGENLAALALKRFREASGWDEGPVRLLIDKRIPVAAGLGGGSADAAGALRLLSAASGLGDDRMLLEIARELGADVPAQVLPGRWLATGAGEQLAELADPISPLGALVLPSSAQLSTAAVYATADRLGTVRDERSLEEHRAALRRALELGAALPGDPELLHNDLQAAAIELCPTIERALGQARDAGAEQALVSGSGPTVVGLFARANGPTRAQRAAADLAQLDPAPIVAESVDRSFARVYRVG